ncbi:hypothetical protein ACIGO9_24740 [Nocardia asteroides]|uniref:DUF7373 family lipoprotein n=1 Tax=Nocardia asteroides TaxID=1824 RepID=UPI0037CA1383
MRLTTLSTVALLALAITSGCGFTDDHDESAIDMNLLETGNYQSVPRNPNESKPDQSGLAIEASRLGATMPIPYDIDSSYGFQSQSNSQVRVTPTIPMSLARVDHDEFRQFTSGLRVGWSTSGHRRLNSTVGRQAFIYNFVFTTPNDAESAMNKIIDEQQRIPSQYDRTVSIPSFPNAMTNWSVTTMDSWMTHGPMLLGVRMVDLLGGPPDPNPSADFTAKAYSKMIDMVAKYTPTPVSELPELPIDVDQMLSRTLPGEPDDQMGGIPDGAVEPLQAAIARDHRPGTTKPALVDAGVDLIATEAHTTVYRAKSSEAATQLMLALLGPNTDYRTPIDSPHNLPIAKCYKRKDDKGPSQVDRPVCFVVFDRYLAQVQGTEVQELHQKTSAQYKLLAVDR